MTIADAFKLFVKALTGKEPAGTTIADVVREGADLMNAPKTEIVLASSTPYSKKQYKVTVDDTGVLKATEIV